ncbi:MAG: hypothetical protein JW945_05860 [Methanomicrobia archaeon]|nr:hypothetical protein [Methanomicrobia archaeon]
MSLIKYYRIDQSSEGGMIWAGFTDLHARVRATIVTMFQRDFDRGASFRPTVQVFTAWAKTNEIQDALGAKRVVFQTWLASTGLRNR